MGSLGMMEELLLEQFVEHKLIELVLVNQIERMVWPLLVANIGSSAKHQR